MFSKACEYALRATIFLAQKSPGKMGIDEIAAAIDSPPPFTAKILQILNKAGVIGSMKGPTGGFYMTEGALQQPVKGVLKPFGEDAVFSKCVVGLMGCSDAKPCPLHGRYKPIRQKLSRLFDTATIKELAEDASNGLSFINNARTAND
jgi:Rrf2 family transcriptional regulator, iron-sulfur cluster assembly transcription factor